MFERFTEKAIKVIMLAQEEARRLGHNFVGTEQVLLGLIGEGTGIAAKTLKSMGVNLKDARIEVEKIIGRGSGFVAVEIPFTPRAKRVLELSWDEARQLGHNYIGTEHLLLGLIREGEGVAARVLENLGVKNALVVYGQDQLDEISSCAPTTVCEVKNGEFKTYVIKPEDFGFKSADKSELVGGTPEENAVITRNILNGEETGAKRTAVLMNAGAALYVAGKAQSIADGIQLAAELIDSKKALAKLEEFIKCSNEE